MSWDPQLLDSLARVFVEAALEQRILQIRPGRIPHKPIVKRYGTNSKPKTSTPNQRIHADRLT